MVFHGGRIDTSVSGNTRYADLENAFVYKEKVVDGCTCNGKDAFGLVPLSVLLGPVWKAISPVRTIASAEASTLSRSRWWAQEFQPFQPIGGVSAIKSPISIVRSAVASLTELATDTVAR